MAPSGPICTPVICSHGDQGSEARWARALRAGGRVAAPVRAAVAARRRGGGRRGHRAGRAEEPRLRGHRRRAAPERALRRGRGRDHLRALLHVAAHLDRAELVARRGRGRRGARDRRSAGTQAAQLVAAITLATGLLFLLLAVFRLGWIAQFLSKAVITGFLAGAAVDVVDRRAAEADRHVRRRGTTPGASSATWLGSLGDIHWTTLLVGAVVARA